MCLSSLFRHKEPDIGRRKVFNTKMCTVDQIKKWIKIQIQDISGRISHLTRDEASEDDGGGGTRGYRSIL
jgi:hypothetical protein